MLSKTSLKYVKNCVKRVDFWGSSPYAWDEEKCRMKYVSTKRRKFFWCLNIATAFLYEFYVIGQCLYVGYFDENASTTMKIYMEYSVLAYAIPVALHIGIIARREEIMEFINQFIDFFEQYKRDSQIQNEESRGKKEEKNGCEKFQSIFLKSGTLICCINLVLIFRRPARPVLLTALVPNAASLSQKPWFILPFAAVHSYLWWSMWSNMYFVAFPMYAYMYPLKKIIDEHCLTSFRTLESAEDTNTTTSEGKRVKIQTAKQLWNLETIARHYRSIQLLQTKANYVYSILLPGHKLLFVLLAIRSIYGAIKMTGGVAILLSVVAVLNCFYLRVTFKVMAQIYEGSLECLFTWKRYRRYPWFSRFLRSCKAVRMEIGSLYYVDRGMVFTLMELIVDNTITLVLSN